MLAQPGYTLSGIAAIQKYALISSTETVQMPTHLPAHQQSFLEQWQLQEIQIGSHVVIHNNKTNIWCDLHQPTQTLLCQYEVAESW